MSGRHEEIILVVIAWSELTVYLCLSKLKPILVLSGHSHPLCALEMKTPATVESSEAQETTEWSQSRVAQSNSNSRQPEGRLAQLVRAWY
ncbi:hypothetical protein LZ31DRAFT_341460 [Colletotrichum somersetense]|nr:hypothetical protein LZ31DRAFT_341460 [Colletotrichum somersetense]